MNIIPLPNYYKIKNEIFKFNYNTTIYFSKEFLNTKKEVFKFFQGKINLIESTNDLCEIYFLLNLELLEEEYIIDIDEYSITIEASTDQGAFYAFQSLKQLFYFENPYYQVKAIYIKDAPKFYYRGLMIDCARHFIEKKEIFKIIDMLALHKFNYLHLHLSDDQGFRFESTKYPNLIKVGSKRENTKVSFQKYTNKPCSGYYSKEDLKEIVNYAKSHFLEVIPEIDMPGHTNAILASYNEISCTKEKGKVSYNMKIKNNALCVTKQETYEFIYNLLDEIIEIFDTKFIHLGCDEVKFRNYRKCETCKKELKKGKCNLMTYFINNLATYLREKGKIPIIWNDFISKKTNYNVICEYWKPFTKRKIIQEINSGRKTIISSFFHLYLDYPYSMTPLEKTYNFNPEFKGIIDTNNILGIEATIWTEYIANNDLLEFQLFPRLAAVSEIAWTNPQNKNYQNFSKRLPHIYKFYDAKFINYNKDATKQDNLIKRLSKTLRWFFKKK